MVNVIKQEVRMEESLRKRLEFICEFCRVKPTIINGNLRTIDKTNLTYLEPHRIIINDITFLAFNYSNEIFVKNMTNYRELKKEQDKNKKRLNELNEKADNLQNKSNQITEIIDNVKPSKLNKNNFTISNKEVEEIKDYIKQTTDTTSNLKSTNDLTTILEKYEEDLKNHSDEVKNLQKKVRIRDEKIEDLQYNLDNANDEIDELEDKISKLEEALNYFKELWRKFIEFLQDKFFSNNKYDDLIQELHEEEILDDNDLDIIKNEYNSYKNKDDDLERL